MSSKFSLKDFSDGCIMIFEAAVPSAYILIGLWFASSHHIFTNNELLAFICICTAGIICEIRKAKNERS